MTFHPVNIKSALLLILFLSLWFSGELFASASLNLPDTFKAISLNGKSYSKFQNHSRKLLPLKSGINLVALQYRSTFKKANKGLTETVTSAIFVVRFYASNDFQYRLRYLAPANLIAAKKYRIVPKFSIWGPKNQPIDFNRFVPNLQSIADLNRITASNKIGPKPILLNTSPLTKKVPLPDKQEASDPEERLFYWWQKADPRQRKRFLEKIDQLQ